MTARRTGWRTWLIRAVGSVYLLMAARIAMSYGSHHGWAFWDVLWGVGMGLMWLPIALVAAAPLVLLSPSHALPLFVIVVRDMLNL